VLQSSAITPTGCQLTWTECTDTKFAQYKLFSSITPGVSENSTQVTVNTNAAQNTRTITGVSGPDTIYYRVYVYDQVGAGTPSNELSVVYPMKLKDWSISKTFTDRDLIGISAVDDSSVWVCGTTTKDSGFISKWNGTSWSPQVIRIPVKGISSIKMLSKTEGYAVADGIGNTDFILRYNGISWDTAFSFSNSAGIRQSSLGVIDSNHFLVGCVPNSTWDNLFEISGNEITSHSRGIGYSIASTGSGLFYILGGNSSNSLSTLFKWSDSRLVTQYKDVDSLEMISLCKDSTLVAYYENGWGSYAAYNIQTIRPSGESSVVDVKVDFNALSGSIYAVTGNDVWIGFAADNSIYHFDGATVTKMTTPSTGWSEIKFSFSSSTHGWAISGSYILEYR
jgi:hypothetical protein